jgi:hypothetical protein
MMVAAAMEVIMEEVVEAAPTQPDTADRSHREAIHMTRRTPADPTIGAHLDPVGKHALAHGLVAGLAVPVVEATMAAVAQQVAAVEVEALAIAPRLRHISLVPMAAILVTAT